MAKTKKIYGIHAVMAALEHHPENILNLFILEKNHDLRLKKVFIQANELNLKVQYRTAPQLEKLIQSADHQGVVAETRLQEKLNEQAIFEWLENCQHAPLFLILENIQDPHNLGACLRSAESLGADWVIVPKVHSAPLNALVSKIASGADQTLPIVETSNIVRFIEKIKKSGIWVVGTSDKAALNIAQVDLTRPTAIVMGTEGKGLKRLTLETCDNIAKIPSVGVVTSLNVSVATGICLYEVLRQRHGIRV